MALIKCKECGKEISDTVSKCIHCGYPLKEQTTVIQKQPIKRNDSFKVSNKLVWIVALIPLLSIVLLWGIWYLFNSFIIGVFVILVFINVSNIFLLLRDYKTLNANQINTDPLGKISAFKILIPKYLYGRAKLLHDNLSYFIIWIVGFILFVIIILIQINPLFLLNSNVNKVKYGTFYSCSDHTINELVNNYIENPKWKSFTSTDGLEIVELSGTVKYNGNRSDLIIQYNINGDEFDFYTILIDDIVKSPSVHNELITKMCNNVAMSDTPINNNNQNNNGNIPQSYIKEIDMESYSSIFDNNTKFILYFGTESSKHCDDYEKALNEVLRQYKLNVYYMDIAKINPDEAPSIIEEVTSLPITFIVGNGKVLDVMYGATDKDRIIEFIQTNGLI